MTGSAGSYKYVLIFIFTIICLVPDSALPAAAPGTPDKSAGAGGIHPGTEALLSDGEKAWLQANRILRVGGPKAFPPFHYFEADGRAQGISSGYTRFIAERLGLKIELSPNLPWPEVLNRSKKGEIDLISCAARTSDREAYLLFSEPYLSFPMVITSRKDAPFIGGIEDLHDMRVACIKKASTFEWLKRDRIAIVPVFVPTPLAALKAVATGQADAHIGNLAAISFLIEKNGLANLKIAAPTIYGNYELFFAVGKDRPELAAMINKVLGAMKPAEHAEIRNLWLSVRYEHGISSAYVVKWVLLVAGMVFCVLFVILLWNRRLKREVIERQQAEQALLASERKYRSLFDGMISGIVYCEGIFDERGRLCDSRYLEMNPAYERFTGLKKDTAVGKTVMELMPGTEQAWFDRLDGVVKTGVPLDFEMYHAFTKKYYAVSAYRPREGTFVATFHDVTQKVQAQKEKAELEKQLTRSKKMEAVGTLAGGVAHDLNNILSGLVSYPDLLLTKLAGDSPMRKPLETIKRSGEKAATIVQDLLTLSRRGVSVTRVVNLNRIISEYLKSPEHENTIRFHPHIQVTTALSADLLNITGSPVHLSKTVMNLVSNAAEAMTGGGTISITTENRYVDRPVKGYDVVEEGDYVLLSVKDTGIGISADDLERIFEPFYTKKVMGRSGTGLGMAVVWGTVKDHKGYVDVLSAPGKGSTFTLYFPVTRRELETREPGICLDELKGSGESILVVDDMEDQREIATEMLKQLGYSVTSVSSGEEAVEYMKEGAADLIVLDMIMAPGMGGRETYERILGDNPGQKAIITSGYAETNDVRRVQEKGAGRYVRKPYALETLGVAVRDELKK